MTSAESINKVDGGRVVGFISRLNTALSHHCICIAYTKLGHYHNLSTRFVCLYCRRGACTASADNKHVYVVIGGFKVDFFRSDPAVCLEHLRKLVGNLVSLVCTDLQLTELFLLVVGMELCQEVFFLFSRHSFGL